MSSQGFRCSHNFTSSDNTIDLKTIKESNIKLDTEVINNFSKYKKSKKSLKKSIGFIKPVSCDKILSNQTKYPKEYSNCKKLKDDKDMYFKKYIEGLTKTIKTKISNKIKKTLKNPKEKRVNKLSCYIKLLSNISDTQYCKSGRNTRISNILSDFERNYKNKKKNEIKQKLAKNYLEYLLTNKTIEAGTLNKYKKWYGKDENFINTLKNITDKIC
jgi:hypothetical protein